jgi:D-3-phosphoglycerate dehydrogenase
VHASRETDVSESVDALVLDLLEWIGHGRRPYAEVMRAWRTSCPRLPVWEDAVERGFVEYRRRPGEPATVSVSRRGRMHLNRARRAASATARTHAGALSPPADRRL